MGAALPAIGAIAAPIIGGVIGNEASRDSREAAKRAMNEARDVWGNLVLPDIEKQKLQYELPYLVGELSPLQEQAASMGPSAMQGVSTDPQLAQKQMMGLQALEQLGQSGFNPQELAAISQMQRGVAQQEQARDKAILQNMQERGMGGSGAELIQRLKSAQTGTDLASQEGQKLAADAAARRLQALQALSQQAGTIRGQEFGEKSQQAQAADAIARFNAQTSADVQQRNIAAQNAAQAANLASRQNIQQQATQLRNLEQEKNKGLYQQQFENALRKAGGQSGAATNAAAQQQQSASQIGSMWSEIGAGAGKGAAAFGTGK